MASPFRISKDENKGSGREEYQKNLAEAKKRFHGDRDAAVRAANVKSGYGNSTAERFKGSSGGGGGDGGGKAKSSGGGKAKSSGGGGGGGKKVDRQKTSSNFSLPKSAPIPTPRQEPFSPDLAVSPRMPPDPMARSAPTNNPPPPLEIAPSPFRGPDPMAASAPTNNPPVRPPMPPALMGVPGDLRQPPPPEAPPLDLSAPPPPQFPADALAGTAPQPQSRGPQPIVGAAPGPNPLVGSSDPNTPGGAGARRAFFARLLGLGG